MTTSEHEKNHKASNACGVRALVLSVVQRSELMLSDSACQAHPRKPVDSVNSSGKSPESVHDDSCDAVS
jgi:hypothetical protein